MEKARRRESFTSVTKRCQGLSAAQSLTRAKIKIPRRTEADCTAICGPSQAELLMALGRDRLSLSVSSFV